MTTTDNTSASEAVSRDGTEIGYFTTGEGPPLVLVHGALGDHTRWRVLRPHLEPHFTVHAMDRRGRGASGDHPDYEPAREHEDLAAVVDAVADGTGSSVAVLGSSTGASFAVGAARLTGNIRRLVLFEPPAGPLAKLKPPGLQERLDGLLAAGDREGILVAAYREIAGLSDAQIDELRAQPEWPNRVAAAHTVPRELATPFEQLLDPEQAAQVTVPALVLVGSETSEAFKASAEIVAEALPKAHVTILEGQAHGAEMFAPEVVAEAVLDFLIDGGLAHGEGEAVMRRSKQEQYQRLLEHVVGYHAAWFVDIGLKTGLFRAIVAHGPSIGEDELAKTLNIDARFVGVWCRGAYAFALLDWDDATGFRLAPHMESLLLDPTDPHFCGGRIQFATALYEDYLAFPDHLRTGEVWPRSEHDPFLLEALQRATEPDGVMITEQVLPQSSTTLERLEAGGDILDIGAGAGQHVLHYARRFPRARVVGLEPDQPSIELARQALAHASLTDRVELRCEDANELAASEAFDLITLNLTLHETGEWNDFHNVLVRVHRALKPGGTVVVSELPYPDSPEEYRQNPVYKLYAGVQLHEALVGCGMITQGQLRELLEGAGFDDVRVAEQSMPTRFVMLAGKDTSS